MKPLKSIILLTALLIIINPAFGAEKKKIIFDTDIAGDIDDAFAHALVQVSPEFEVLGITVADGPTDKRARVSCKMLYVCGQENIPVAVGRETRQGSRLPMQLKWGEGFDKYKPIEKPAADFIIEQLRKYPNEITIISVGPVTNLGDVIEKDPEAWKLVKEVYSMFGSFYRGYDRGPVPHAEWNVRADVESSQKLIDSGVPLTLVGLDVTTSAMFGPQRRLRLLYRNSPLTDSLCSLYSLWNDAETDPMLHDPLAVTAAITDDFLTTRPAHVKVDDEGYTLLDNSQAPNCRIAMHFRKEPFMDWLTTRLLDQNLSRQ